MRFDRASSFHSNHFMKNLHHIGTTFKVNIENFLLHISLVANQHARGVPTSFSFMKSCSAENLDFFYECLGGKRFLENCELEILNPELAKLNPVVIIIDKDLTNIELLQKYFPDSQILLCTFHVIK